MRDYKTNTFQMNNSIFQFGLTPIQFVVYSCLRSSVKRALNVLRDRGFIDIKGGAQNCVVKVIGKPATATIVWIAVSGNHR